VSDPAGVDEVRTQVEELRAQLRDLEDRQASAEAERRAPRAGRTKGRHEGEVSVTTETWTKSRDTDNRREWERAVERSLARRRRRWAARARRWTMILAVWLVITGPAAVLWGKGSPWAAPDCGRTDNTAAIATESVGVRTAKLNGRLLHRLAGKPPTAEEMRTAADKAGKTAIVFLAALRSSARGQRDPAVVSSYNAAYRARNAATCAPPCPDMSTLPGLRTVAATTGPALAADQAATAATIVRVGRSMGVPDRGIVVAVAAARQESGLRNLDHGDRDSLGVFQQRASWGTAGQRMNPEWAAGAFYRALQRVPGWQAMSVAQAAQAVQVSAYPAAYARWEPLAVAVVGGQPVADCTSSAPSTYKTGAGVAWGPVGGPAYANGRIPLSALAHPRSAPAAWLRPDAADALDRLSAAYAARFGHPLGVTDSYRDYPHQVTTKARKGNLAAKPGTSNHGWALALDLRVGGYGSTDYLWLRANAPTFGWDNPDWARPGGTKREFWHWEWQPIGART
jgi:hypothetical protein